MSLPKKTLVIGASDNPERYSFRAVNWLRSKGHPVIAIGHKPTKVADVPVQTEQAPISDLDTVTLYIGARLQPQYYDYIIGLHPKRIIFNPGTENPELETLAISNGIQPMHACTLVMLSTGQY